MDSTDPDYKSAIARWVTSANKRFEICRACEYWGQTKFGWIGCLKCNCTQAKTMLGFPRCPIGKW